MEVNVRLEVGVYSQDCLTECMCEHVGICYYRDLIQTVACNCSGTGHHGSKCQIRGRCL